MRSFISPGRLILVFSMLYVFQYTPFGLFLVHQLGLLHFLLVIRQAALHSHLVHLIQELFIFFYLFAGILSELLDHAVRAALVPLHVLDKHLAPELHFVEHGDGCIASLVEHPLAPPHLVPAALINHLNNYNATRLARSLGLFFGQLYAVFDVEV